MSIALIELDVLIALLWMLSVKPSSVAKTNNLSLKHMAVMPVIVVERQ